MRNNFCAHSEWKISPHYAADSRSVQASSERCGEMGSGTTLWPGLISVLLVVDSSSPHAMCKPRSRVFFLSKKPNWTDHWTNQLLLSPWLQHPILLLRSALQSAEWRWLAAFALMQALMLLRGQD